MNTLPVTQLFVQVNTYRTPSSRDGLRAQLDAALAEYNGPIEQLPAYQSKPLPARKRRVLAEYKLSRKPAKKDDPRILEAIKAAPGEITAAAIAKQLCAQGVQAKAGDVDRIAALAGIRLLRAWEMGE